MKGKQKTMVGSVISHKMDKTAVVAVEKLTHHRLYHKAVRKVVKYKVDDRESECGVGDVVRIMETRPISKEKRWKVIGIVSKGEVVAVKPQEIT